jgi:hypothetical protein
MGDRDCVGEMDALIAAVTKGDGWVPRLVAEKILSLADPVLLDAWLRQMAGEILTDMLAKRRRSAKAAARADAAPQAFAKARAAAEHGDLAALGSFAASYAVDEKETSRKVGDMTGADHEFVAARCDSAANSAALLAEFHRQIARRVGPKKTSQVLTEKQYDEMYRSITGGRAALDAAI